MCSSNEYFALAGRPAEVENSHRELGRRDWFVASGSQVLCHMCGSRGVFVRPLAKHVERVLLECYSCGSVARLVDLLTFMGLDLGEDVVGKDVAGEEVPEDDLDFFESFLKGDA